MRKTRAELKWLDQPDVYRVNQLPAHSDHIYYESMEAYEQKKSGFEQNLNGEWDFCYSANSKSRPADFYRTDYNRKNFRKIVVPSHIELSGYDKIHYINTMYPWEGHVFRRPGGLCGNWDKNAAGFAQADDNPVGSYIKEFDLDSFMIGKRITVCFEGVEQAMYVWLNGNFIGYAEDSFTPSEFDLTPYIREKGNVLAVEVYKRSSAAFLEDQDFFRFFGIFRDVKLYAKPAVHLDDIWVKTELLSDNKTGCLALEMMLSGEQEMLPEGTRLKLHLRDRAGNTLLTQEMNADRTVVLEQTIIGNVIPWDSMQPYLYTLTVEVRDIEDKLLEIAAVQTGFRRIEIKDKIILLNGKRLILCGVNRHEWNPASGRCITRSDMEDDIRLCKANHINAVRTCHYPDQLYWYTLCDENGIILMSETNLESHGSWQKMGEVEPSWNVPGSVSIWKGAVLDRAKTHFEVLKNHPSILFWSLGNESYAGDNIREMNRYFKEKEPDRLVHYEGVFHNRKYEDSVSDVESRMYASPESIREYLSNDPKKPFLLCEYMHDMGNSLGGLGSYSKLLEDYEMFQGGFIWDFIDQALWVKDEITGEKALRYGGDFDDRPSDYEFSGDGIFFADRTEKPAVQEVRYYYGKWQQ